jgi:hypothetical protein
MLGDDAERSASLCMRRPRRLLVWAGSGSYPELSQLPCRIALEVPCRVFSHTVAGPLALQPSPVANSSGSMHAMYSARHPSSLLSPKSGGGSGPQRYRASCSGKSRGSHAQLSGM